MISDYRMPEGVAQNCILPYRRFLICRLQEKSSAPGLTDDLQNAILRYSGLKICATLSGSDRSSPITDHQLLATDY
jgi:hypothetical protein